MILLLVGCGGDEPDGPSVGDGRGGVRPVSIGSFDRPVQLVQPAAGSRDLYVVEQAGAVWRLVDGRGAPRPFLDLRAKTAAVGEAGLLSLAFAPDFDRSGRLYADYIDRRGATVVAEYRLAGGAVDPASERILLRIPQPKPTHDVGGLMLFGPDRLLYIALGDGAQSGDAQRSAQDLGTLQGKILRIDPRPDGGRPYAIPRSNPFVGRAGARPEVLAYGLRNPWRFSFDPDSRSIWIGDVGEHAFEEVNAVEGDGAGKNFGWSAYEGLRRFNRDQRAPNETPPIHVAPHSQANCALIGGYVVRDRRLPSLYGRYLYGDVCNGQLRSFAARRALDVGKAEDDRGVGVKVEGPSAFGQDAAGRIYVVSLVGDVYRLDPAE